MFLLSIHSGNYFPNSYSSTSKFRSFAFDTAPFYSKNHFKQANDYISANAFLTITYLKENILPNDPDGFTQDPTLHHEFNQVHVCKYK